MATIVMIVLVIIITNSKGGSICGIRNRPRGLGNILHKHLTSPTMARSAPPGGCLWSYVPNIMLPLVSNVPKAPSCLAQKPQKTQF